VGYDFASFVLYDIDVQIFLVNWLVMK